MVKLYLSFWESECFKPLSQTPKGKYLKNESKIKTWWGEEWNRKREGEAPREERGCQHKSHLPAKCLRGTEWSERCFCFYQAFLKPILSRGIQTKGGGYDVAADVFIYIHIYIHWNIIKTFPSQSGNSFSSLQLLVAAYSLLELVCAGKLPGDRAEPSEIMWEGQFLALFPYFLMQSSVTMLYPSKHGNGAKETLLCLPLKIIGGMGTPVWIQTA